MMIMMMMMVVKFDYFPQNFSLTHGNGCVDDGDYDQKMMLMLMKTFDYLFYSFLDK